MYVCNDIVKSSAKKIIDKIIKRFLNIYIEIPILEKRMFTICFSAAWLKAFSWLESFERSLHKAA